MGGVDFTHWVQAPTPQAAYNAVVRRIRDRYECSMHFGAYNGTILTCDLDRCTLTLPGIYTEDRDREIKQHIMEEDHGRKWRARWVDAGIVEGSDEHMFVLYGIAAD